MISDKCYTLDWIQKKKAEIKATDAGILERVIHAFALLGHLKECGLDFVFKGGTSILLHAPEVRRFSIDIDILCAASTDELKRVLDEVGKKPPFLRYSEDDRGERGLPNRRHFKFFYQPLLGADHVLLDVVEEENVPHVIETKRIYVPFLEFEREVSVNVPTIESLLADKLTAFAPRTTGVPFEPKNGKKPELQQILKQLFDVGELFMLAEDLGVIRSTYRKVFDLENEYRKGGLQMSDALDDTFATSLAYCLHGLKKEPQHPDVPLLESGRKSLASHLVNHTFDLPAAKIAAAKAALLTRLIVMEDVNPSLAHWRAMPNLEAFRTLEITGEWSRVNSMRSSLPEVFWYWYQTSRLG